MILRKSCNQRYASWQERDLHTGGKPAMKNIWRGLSLAILLIGIVSFSQVKYGLKGLRAQDTVKAYEPTDVEPVQPFVARFVDYRVTPDGKKVMVGRRTRYVNGSGEWRESAFGPKGDEASLEVSKQTVVSVGGPEGVYRRGKGLEFRRYVSPAADDKMQRLFRSRSYLRSVGSFVRTEVLAGIEVFVLRSEINDSANSERWIEKSYSPKTGFNPLRTTIHFDDGSEFRIEATRIEFRHVPDSLNADINALPTAPNEEK